MQSLLSKLRSPLSLRQTIWLMTYVGVITLFPIITSGIVFFTARVEEQAWRGRQGEAANAAAFTVSEFIHRTDNALIMLASFGRDELVEDEDSPAEEDSDEREFLETFLQNNPAILEIVYLDGNGRVLANAPREQPLLANTFTASQSQWFRVAQGGERYESPLQVSSADEPYLILARPSGDGGVIAARVRMQVLWDAVRGIRFGERGSAYVVSLEGEVIAHSDPALVLARENIADRPEFAEMLAAPDYKWHGSYRNFQNVDVVGSSAGVAEGEDLRPDWIVVTELPRWEAYAATRTALIVIGGSLFALLMLVGWVSAQLADRRFLHPLDRLSEGAARFGRGELEYRIHLPHRDEIGKLGEAFNAMGSQLELRQAELLEAETRLRNIVEGLPGIAYVAEFGEYGAWLYVSPQIESILGYPPQEWQADPQLWSRCVHPEDRRKVLEDESNQWERSPDRHHTIEYRLLARDGRLVWVRDEYVTLRDENGVPRLWQGVLYDITDRKQAEQALRRREAILSAVGYAAERFLQAPAFAESIQDVLERLGLAGGVSRTYIFENRLADGEILCSQRYEWVAPGVAPQIENEDFQNFSIRSNGYGRWEEMLGAGQVVHGHIRDFPENERGLFEMQGILSVAVVPIFRGGEWWGFIGFDDCETERDWSPAELDALRAAAGMLGAALRRQQIEETLRQNERKYHSILEDITELVVRFLPDGTITYVNDAYCRYYKKTREELIGASIFADAIEDFPQKLREHFESFTLDRPIALFEQYDVLPGGEKRWREWVDRALFDDAGNLVEFQSTGRDISMRRQAEQERGHLLVKIQVHAAELEAANEELRRAHDAAETASRAKSEFLSLLSHELRTPLNAILGFSQLLEMDADSLTERAAKGVRQINQSGRQMLAMIDDLLDLTRVDTGRLSLDLQAVDAASAVATVCTALTPAAGKKRIRLTVGTLPTLRTVRADPRRLDRILRILVGNAIEFTPEDGYVNIGMRVAQIPTTDPALQDAIGETRIGLRISVSDTGIGIRPSLLPRLFEPFTQAEPSATRSHGGLGIGLALARRLAESHGGRIWAESEGEGKGSTFHLELPLDMPQTSEVLSKE